MTTFTFGGTRVVRHPWEHGWRGCTAIVTMTQAWGDAAHGERRGMKRNTVVVILVGGVAVAALGGRVAPRVLSKRVADPTDVPYDSTRAFLRAVGPIVVPPDVMLPDDPGGAPLEQPPFVPKPPGSIEELAAAFVASGGDPAWAGPVIVVSRTTLRVPQAELVLELPPDPERGFDARVKRGSRLDFYVVPLGQSLQWLHDQWAQVARVASREASRLAFTLVADRDTPQRILAEVMFAAGQAGFGTFRVAGRAGDRLVTTTRAGAAR